MASLSRGAGYLIGGFTFKGSGEQDILTVARYVERNALRAQLVKRAENWRWSSLWRRYKGEAKAKALLSPWPVARPRNWVRYVNQVQTPQELEALRRSVQRGRPFGSEAWQVRIAKRLGLESTLRPRGRPRKENKV